MNIDSDAFTFAVPWYGVLEGEVLAGKSDVSVPNVRVCARLKSVSTASNVSVGTMSSVESPRLASHTHVLHSNGTRASEAYRITDTYTGTSVELDKTEYFKIDLNIFTSISSVSVCIASETNITSGPSFIVRVMDYDNPDDVGDTGNKCIENGISPVANANVCIKYLCKGTHITRFPGQYITILSAEVTTQNIAEVTATGSEITCPYSSFSDDGGFFEIEILEENAVSAKNAKVGVLAFKTDIFDRIDRTIFQTVANNTVTSVPRPEAVLIALEYDATGSVASLGASESSVSPPSPFADSDTNVGNSSYSRDRYLHGTDTSQWISLGNCFSVDDFKINSMQGELSFGVFTTVTQGVESNGDHIDAVNINEVNFTKFVTYDNNNVKGKNASFLAYSEGNIDADETVGLRMIHFDIRRETNSHEQVAVQAYHDDDDYTFDDDTISYQAHKGGDAFHSSSGDRGDSYSSSEHEGWNDYHSSSGDSYSSSKNKDDNSDSHSSSFAANQQYTTATTTVK